MKKIEAIVRPFKCDQVKAAIEGLGHRGMTLTEVRGMGRARGEASLFPGAALALELLPKVKIEVVVPDAAVAALVPAIREAAASGQVGDGKIFVSPVEAAIAIRTGEAGDSALGPSLDPADLSYRP